MYCGPTVRRREEKKERGGRRREEEKEEDTAEKKQNLTRGVRKNVCFSKRNVDRFHIRRLLVLLPVCFEAFSKSAIAIRGRAEHRERFTFCVCFCVPPLLNFYENPTTSAREKNKVKQHKYLLPARTCANNPNILKPYTRPRY